MKGAIAKLFYISPSVAYFYYGLLSTQLVKPRLPVMEPGCYGTWISSVGRELTRMIASFFTAGLWTDYEKECC